jgi:hypothetical protein
MKKLLALSLVVAVIAACFFFFFNGERKGRVTPAVFLPEDVLVCLTQKDLGRLLDDFKESRLGKTFTLIDLVRMAEDMGLPEEDRLMFKKVQEEGNAFLKGPIFKEIFSNEFSVALLPLDMQNLETPVRMEEHLLLIAKPEHGTQLVNLLTSGFIKVQNQTNVPYGKHTIKRFQLEKEKTLATVAVQDLVLMALDERIIHDCLDRYDRKKRALGDNDTFQKLRASFEKPVFFSYFGMESLKKQMEMLLEKMDIKQKDILRDELKKWSGLRVAGYGVWRETDRIRDKGVFLVEHEKLDPILKNLYGTPPEKNSTLAIVPQRVLAYYWTNTLDLLTYWKMYQDGSVQKQEKIDGIRKAAKKQSELDIETILGLLDKQCGLMIKDTDAKRFVPIPDFSIFMRLKDSNRFSELARNVLKNNGLQVQVQNYKDININSMAGFSQGGLLPVYAIHDQYLFVASSMAMIKEIIDTIKDGHGLADNPDFQKVNSGLLEENNSVGYVRVGDLMRAVKGMVNWGRTMVAIQDQESTKKMEILIDRLVNPLLDSLSMYSVFGMRSRIAPNQIIIESATIIEK